MNEAETVKVGDVWEFVSGPKLTVRSVWGNYIWASEKPTRQGYLYNRDRFISALALARLIERDGHPVKEQGGG